MSLSDISDIQPLLYVLSRRHAARLADHPVHCRDRFEVVGRGQRYVHYVGSIMPEALRRAENLVRRAGVQPHALAKQVRSRRGVAELVARQVLEQLAENRLLRLARQPQKEVSREEL